MKDLRVNARTVRDAVVIQNILDQLRLAFLGRLANGHDLRYIYTDDRDGKIQSVTFHVMPKEVI